MAHVGTQYYNSIAGTNYQNWPWTPCDAQGYDDIATFDAYINVPVNFVNTADTSSYPGMLGLWNHLTLKNSFYGLNTFNGIPWVGNANANNLAAYALLSDSYSPNQIQQCGGYYAMNSPFNAGTYPAGSVGAGGGFIGCLAQQYKNFVQSNPGTIPCLFFQNKFDTYMLKVYQQVWGSGFPGNVVLNQYGAPGIQYCTNPNANVTNSSFGWCKSWYYQFGRKHAKAHYIQTLRPKCGCPSTVPMIDPWANWVAPIAPDPVSSAQEPVDLEKQLSNPPPGLAANSIDFARVNGEVLLEKGVNVVETVYKDIISIAEIITSASKGERGKKIIIEAMEDFVEKYPPLPDQIHDISSDEDDEKLLEYYKTREDE